MNSFGNFLYELRKEKRITQAQLAEKLGVSNKAVSKWETGEAMPETSLLLPISKIFDVTVDELLNGKRTCPIADSNSAEDKSSKGDQRKAEILENFDISKHLFTRGKDDMQGKTILEMVCGIVCGSIFLCGLAIYLILGAVLNLWHPYWVIVPCCALGCGIVAIMFDFFNSKKCQSKLQKGENPYSGGICGIVMLVSIIIYLALGVSINFWHPGWIICACAGVACGVIGAIGNLFVVKYKKQEENDKIE